MNFPYYAYITIVLFSAFSLGTVALALVLNAKSRQVSNALFKLGYLLTVGTILWTITPRHEVVPSGRSIVYLVGLIFAGIGGAGNRPESHQSPHRASRGRGIEQARQAAGCDPESIEK